MYETLSIIRIIARSLKCQLQHIVMIILICTKIHVIIGLLLIHHLVNELIELVVVHDKKEGRFERRFRVREHIWVYLSWLLCQVSPPHIKYTCSDRRGQGYVTVIDLTIPCHCHTGTSVDIPSHPHMPPVHVVHHQTVVLLCLCNT